MEVKHIKEELILIVKIRDLKIYTNRKIHKPEILNLGLLLCVNHGQTSEGLWGFFSFYSFEIIYRMLCTVGRDFGHFIPLSQ